MAYAHSKRVIHRDLKPGNVMVGRFGEVYVMDWGMARVLDHEDPRDLRLRGVDQSTILSARRDARADDDPESPLFTMDGAVVGTPYYMPPEQAGGLIEDVDQRSDVYSIGAMLYHLLTGQPPYFRPESQSAYGVLARVIQGPPPPVAELRQGVPAELEAVCEKAMARKREGRYADTGELAEDLRAFLEKRVVKAYEAGAVAELKKWVRRNRLAAAAGLAAVVAVVGGLAWSRSVEARGKTEISLQADAFLAPYLIRAAGDLWPAHPENVPAMEAWLADAERLVARRAVHEARAASLGAGAATGPADAARERERRGRLLEDLDALRSDAGGLVTDVRRRLEFARAVGERTLTGAEATARWSAAITSIADAAECPAYGGLVIEPQVGLLPLARNPDSGLWEFAHLQTGEPPALDPDGRVVVTPETGMVFVLLPGGPFTMGAQWKDEAAPHYDPHADFDESQPHELVLAPFFLSKFEVTQGQWMRHFEHNPGFLNPADPRWEVTLQHPVEYVTWYECADLARRLGLALPTEAQWEYAARGGTSTVWWTGDAKETLAAGANLADLTLRKARPRKEQSWEDWDDGHGIHAPVGSYLPNGFGLHDMAGNVWEWCLDENGALYNAPPREGDGLRRGGNHDTRSYRGGGWQDTSPFLRSANRQTGSPSIRHFATGVRLARPLSRGAPH